MAKRAHAYPQVDPGAAGLVSRTVATAAATTRVGEGLRLARRRDAAALGIGAGRWVLREDLARAAALGLGDLPLADLARPLPTVRADESEIAVRRSLAGGAPLAVVHDGRRALGAVTARASAMPGPALAARFARALAPDVQALLGVVGTTAAARGATAYVVGGLVRDVLLDRPVARHDLDVVVEGDGLGVARALAERLGGTVVEHARFLTASTDAPGAGRIDVATARAERYEVPGALPRVVPATIAQDLVRRDFTVNAMAVELGSGAFTLLDPFGGRADLERRRLRVLHPLSFVEDPTRIFRAARYAARLGFTLEAGTARARALALRLVPYGALSGARLTNELARILADERPAVALRALGTAGAGRLLDPAYRFTATTARRIAALPEVLGWAREHALRVEPVELVLVALLADQRPAVAAAALRRLGLSGEPLTRVERALASPPAPPAPGRASERATALRARGDLALAWLRLAGDAAARAEAAWFVAAARDVEPALRGNDLLALGVPRGPRVAAARDALRAARLDGAVRDREGEIEYVRDWLRAREEG